MANSIAWVLSKLRFPLSVALGGTGKTSLGEASVGTVSQTGGVPTGAVIERGSNAYGQFIKYADGTLICWIVQSFTNQNINSGYGAMFNGASGGSLPYPHAFITAPAVIQQYHSSGISVVFTGFGNLSSNTQWGPCFPFDAQSRTGVGLELHRFAIGRWY